MSKETKKYGSADIAKMLTKLDKMTDDKLKDVYLNVDWDDFIFLDVGQIVGELGVRGWDIVETVDEKDDSICYLEFVAILPKEKVA